MGRVGGVAGKDGAQDEDAAKIFPDARWSQLRQEWLPGGPE